MSRDNGLFAESEMSSGNGIVGKGGGCGGGGGRRVKGKRSTVHLIGSRCLTLLV